MTCRDVTAFLMAYLAGELPGNVRETFDRHLDRCAACREFLHQYQTTLALSQQLACNDDDCDVPDDLIAAIKASLDAERR